MPVSEARIRGSLKSDIFHPVTWWTLGLLFSAAAILAKQALPLIVLATSAVLLSMIFGVRWFQSMRFYFILAGLIFLTRLIFRIIFSFGDGGGVSTESFLAFLPKVEIDLGFGGDIALLGPISQAGFEHALLDGLRLATIILSIGMATTLCHPRRLLKFTPSALYEIAAAVSMAINLAPQLVTSIQRVRQARELRGRSGSLSAMTSIVIPVLEDTIEASMNLAESMSSRGFGRTGPMTRIERRLARFSSLAAVSLIIIGTYLALTVGLTNALSATSIVLGLAFSFLTLKLASAKKLRTSHSIQKLQLVDAATLAIAALGFASVALGWWN
jgi:energy-coupling factor transport system permease protein